jgi:hypothetical protein
MGSSNFDVREPPLPGGKCTNRNEILFRSTFPGLFQQAALAFVARGESLKRAARQENIG